MDTGRRIRVLFITKWFMNRFDPQLGVFIRKHASAASLYCDVSLLYITGDPDQTAPIEFVEKEDHGVKVTLVYFRKYRSHFPGLEKIINLIRYFRAGAAGLARIEAKTGRHDITNAYIMLRPAFLAWWLRRKKGIPFVISEQWSGYATGKFSEKNFAVRFLYRWIFGKADAVTAVSEYLAHRMQASGLRNNYTITPNVIEPAGKNASPLPPAEKVRIITVADLADDIKNISSTIRAVYSISKKNPDVEFHIVGHGKDEQLLKKLASDLGLLNQTVFFHGVKTNEEVFQYLHACDFLVMNSRFETFSLICIEAMSCGKPVVATRCGGPEEFMNERNGILIRPDDFNQLRQAIGTMISSFREYDPGELKAFARKNFSAEKTGAQFRDLYRYILRKTHSSR